MIRIPRGYRSVCASLWVLLLMACQTTQQSPIDEPSTRDGLVRVELKGVDAVYKKPQANLAGYNKILLRPVEVSFSRNWKPENDSALYTMNKPDREKIKQELASVFRDVFKVSRQRDDCNEAAGKWTVSHADRNHDWSNRRSLYEDTQL